MIFGLNMDQVTFDIILTISGPVLIFIFRAFNIDLYVKVKLLFNRLRFRISWLVLKRNYIYFFIDADSQDIAKTGLWHKIKSTLRRTKMVTISNPEEILSLPFSTSYVKAVIVLVTDVMPLSSDPKKRRKIQTLMRQYVNDGGLLILGHDVIYRRARNNILQSLAGGRLIKFERMDGKEVQYRLNRNSIPGKTVPFDLTGFNEAFGLRDREVVHGRWEADVKFLYVFDHQTQENYSEVIPLVTYRSCGNGAVFWINSGDTTEEGLPRSILEPQPEFASLLSNILLHRREILAVNS